MTDFHELLPCRQYNDVTTICNTVRSQLNSDPVHDVRKMAAQKAVLSYSFAFNTRDEHFYNLKLLYLAFKSNTLI